MKLPFSKTFEFQMWKKDCIEFPVYVLEKDGFSRLEKSIF
jgi:hypothetical protein